MRERGAGGAGKGCVRCPVWYPYPQVAHGFCLVTGGRACVPIDTTAPPRHCVTAVLYLRGSG